MVLQLMKKCVINLFNENTIVVGFNKKSIFIDYMDELCLYMLLQTVNNVSTFTSERNMSGLNVSVDPKHLHNALSMCINNSPITILIDNKTLKVIQDNASYTLPVKDFGRGNSFREELINKIRVKESDVITTMEVEMYEIKNTFKKIRAAEYFGIFPPFYRFRFDEETPSIRKGDSSNHNLTILLKSYNFSGVRSDIDLSSTIEKVSNIFYPDSVVEMKSYKEFVIQMSQTKMNSEIDFIMGGMSE